MSEDHSIPVRFWIASETDKLVRRIAATEERSVSSVYRGLIHSGLQAAVYRGDGKTMEEQYKAALQETLKPYVDRLAAISAKGTQISAAAFFLAAYNGKQALPEYAQEAYEEVAAMSRKLGIEYLKLAKDQNLDEFLGKGLRKLDDV